jgi:hypothetical protein
MAPEKPSLDLTRLRKMAHAVVYGDLAARQYAKSVLEKELDAATVLALLDRLDQQSAGGGGPSCAQRCLHGTAI